jgi:hypothetical protein
MPPPGGLEQHPPWGDASERLDRWLMIRHAAVVPARLAD